jgi:trehalose-phosphatase
MADTDVERAAAAVRRLRAGRHLLLLLDFDGTLCEFDPDPEAVFLPEPRRSVLLTLASRHDVTLAVISGRRLADVRRRTQLTDRTFYAGLHGLEIEGPGISFVHPGAARAAGAIRQLAAALAKDLEDMPGVFIEDKALSMAAHFREARPEDAARVPAIVERHARAAVDTGLIRLMHGAMVVELLPNIEWNKGSAVRWIREMVAADRDVAAVYIGDDLTDEDAFEAVRGSGLAIAASARAVGADLQVDGPGEVERLLRALTGPAAGASTSQRTRRVRR